MESKLKEREGEMRQIVSKHESDLNASKKLNILLENEKQKLQVILDENLSLVEVAKAEKETLRKSVGELTNELEVKKEAFRDVQDSVTELQQLLQQKTAELQALQSTCDVKDLSFKQELKSKTKAVELFEEKLNEMKQDAIQKNTALDENIELLNNAQEELKNVQTEVFALKESNAKLEEEVSARNTEFENFKMKMQSEIEMKVEQFELKSRQLLQVENDYKVLTENQAGHDEKYSNFKQELKSKTKAVELFEEKLNEMKQDAIQKNTALDENIELLNNAQEELKNVQTEVFALKESNAKLEEEVSARNTEFENFKMKMQSEIEMKVEQFELKSRQLLQVENDYKVLTENQAGHDEKYSNFKQELKSKTELIELLEEKLNEMKQDAIQKNTALDENIELLNNAQEELKNVQTEVFALKESNAKLEEEVSARNTEFENFRMKMQSEIEMKVEQFELKSRQLLQVENDYKALKEDLACKTEKVYAIEKQFADLKESAKKLETRAIAAENEVGRMIKDRAEIALKNQEKDQSSVDSKLIPDIDVEELKEEISVLQLQKKRCMNECMSLEKLLDEKEDEIEKIKNDKSMLEKLVESTKTNVIVELSQLKKDLAEKEGEIEKLTLHKEKISHFEIALAGKEAELYASVCECEARNASIEELKIKISNFETVLSSDDDRLEQVKLLEEQQHLSDVEKNFVVVYYEFKKLTDKHDDLVHSYNALSQELQNQKEENLQTTAALERFKAEVITAQENLHSHEESTLKVTDERNQLKEELGESHQKINELQTRLEVARSSGKGKYTENLLLKEQMEKANLEVYELKDQYAQLELQHTEAMALLKTANQAVNDKSDVVVELNSVLKKEKERISVLEADLHTAQDSLKEREKMFTEGKEYVKDLKNEIEQLTASINELHSCEDSKQKSTEKQFNEKKQIYQQQLNEMKVLFTKCILY